ncbi:MAG: hypothetical protein ACP5JB_08000 [candidate division WOR-3 bacterium]|jgi:hypothetical protein
MACFLVPATTGVVTTLLQKKIPKRLHPEWLNAMLWGGTAMLAVEHYAHGEVVPYPPFLTAMKNPADIGQMVQEMVTVGGTMVVFVVGVWLLLVFLAERLAVRGLGPARNRGG